MRLEREAGLSRSRSAGDPQTGRVDSVPPALERPPTESTGASEEVSPPQVRASSEAGAV